MTLNLAFLRADADGGMERGVYATATGMITAQRAMDLIANNLANVSTNGFKRDGLAFNDALEREMAVGGRSIGSLGSGATVQSTFTDFSAGSLNESGNPLDLAILGEKGLFGIQTDAGIRYTRDGAFAVNANRQLVTKDGFPVLDDQSKPITLDAGQVSIQADGSIQIDGDIKGKIGVFDASGLTKEGGNRFVASNATAIQATVKSGAVETSNVNAVDAMVQMIQLSRLFEMSQRSIVSQDELSQRLIQSMNER